MMLSLSIGPASSKNVSEALQLVFRDLPAESRERYVHALEEGVRSGSVPSDGVLEARRGGQLVGAVFFQRQAGRAAVVWPPRLLAGEPAGTAAHLLEAASDLIAHQGIRVANALLPTASQPDDAVLRGNNYQPLAELIYLVSEEDHFPRVRPAGTLEFDPYCAASRDRLVHILEATYEDTLDCPQLNGVRDTEDVLEGYQATGVYDPARWLIARHGFQDVGCLLLADHPEDDSRELVYMGLIASARGRGWGTEITRHAQWSTAQAGRSRLVVAVDAANTPAIHMYTAAGFREWDRRVVYLKVMSDG